MKLLEVHMEDFRQFLGEAKIDFALEDDSSVTIVHGENGVGKTTILNAIHWCFYGTSLSDFEKPDVLVNDTAFNNQGKKTAKVEVRFLHNDTVYRIQRVYDQEKKRSEVSGFTVVQGNNTPVDGIAAVVQRIIPIHMAPYFFFHGEGLNSLGAGVGRNSFKDAIRAILGFNHADKSISLMAQIRVKWQKETAKLARLDAQGREALEKEAQASEDITVAETQYVEAQQSLGVVEARLSELNEEIAGINVQNVEALVERRQKLEHRQRRIPKEMVSIVNQQVNLIAKYGWSIFGYSSLKDSAEVLQSFRSKRKLPSEYNDRFIKLLLKDGKCICGAELGESSGARANVESMLAGASTSDQEDALTSAIGIAENIEDVADEYTRRVTKLSGARQQLKDEEGSINRKLEDIKNQLAQIDHSKLAQLEADREDARGLASRLRDQRHLCKINLDNARRAKEEAKRKKKSTVDENLLGTHQTRLDFIDLVIEKLTKVIELEESSARTEIEKIVNDRLEKYSRKDYYTEVKEDFSFELKKEDGSAVAKSKGERALLNISFISALIQLAKNRSDLANEYFVQGTVAPFVIDAPFGELDNEYRGAVAKFLPESTEQLVVLLKDSCGCG
jgi:DNA sulfur modification protein DndD